MNLQVLANPRFRGFVILSSLLVLYANLRVVFSIYVFDISEVVLTIASLSVSGLLLVWALRIDRLSLNALGIRRQGAFTQGQVGLIFGAMLVLPAVLFLAFPPSGVPSISVGGVQALGRGELFLQIFLRMPLGTIIIEELAFRGILLANLKRFTTVPWAIIGSSAVFAVWHIGVNFHIMETSLKSNQDIVAVVTFAGLYLGVFFAGCIWAALKELTNHLAAPMVAHWVVNSAMFVVVFLNSGKVS